MNYELRIKNLSTGLIVLASITLNSALTTPAYAASPCPDYQTDFGCLPENPAQFGSAVYNVGLGMIGAVALLFIVYGGYLILTSQGNVEQLNKGKSYIFYSIVGIILAVSGFAFYQIVARDIIKIPGFAP